MAFKVILEPDRLTSNVNHIESLIASLKDKDRLKRGLVVTGQGLLEQGRSCWDGTRAAKDKELVEWSRNFCIWVESRPVHLVSGTLMRGSREQKK